MTSVEIMALHRSVMKNGILCELYADTCTNVPDDGENEILDRDFPTAPPCEQL
jgi:hypothetical protein